MKRSKSNLQTIPLPEWSRIALQFGEMWLASLQVIAYRTTRMAAAGPMPDARDREEFSLMGQEKVQAASESAMAFAAHLANRERNFGIPALGDVASGTAAFAAVSEMSAFVARLAGSGLAPIHARATANARRLGGN
jgi:hypothetical protein